MVAACAVEEEPTCNEKRTLEAARAQAAFERLCAGEASINDLIQFFFRPPHATNPADQQKALAHFITRAEICAPQNHLAVDCDDEEPCEDPQPTFCDDPEECESKFYGIGLLELIENYIRTSSIAYMPVASLADAVDGDTLVFDASAVPDNPSCDPCVETSLGAWVPQSVYEAVV